MASHKAQILYPEGTEILGELLSTFTGYHYDSCHKYIGFCFILYATRNRGLDFFAVRCSDFLITRHAALPVPLNLLSKNVLHLGTAPGLDVGVEEDVNLLQRPTCRFRIREEDMHCHNGTEHAENDIGLPFDVVESRSNKVCKCKVEDPVGGSGHSNALRTVFEREHFR